MKFGLSKDTIDAICSVLKKYSQIEKVVLYGSRAKGNYRNGSDIDLTLIGKELDLRTLSKVSHDLDDLLTPYKFDLSIFDDIENLDLIDHINRLGVDFYTQKKAD